MTPEAEVQPLDDSFAVQASIARQYGQRTLHALTGIVRLTQIGANFVERGPAWYAGDPFNAPGLACEALVIKIGENVSRVSPEFEGDHPEVPWQVIKDMGNRLTHYYESTDYAVVWATLETDFPAIRAAIDQMLGRSRS